MRRGVWCLQAHARRFQLPIDLLKFGTQVMLYAGLEQTPQPPETGAYIHGMVMEGARFDAEQVSHVRLRRDAHTYVQKA